MATYYISYTTGNDTWDGLSPEYVSGTNGPKKTMYNFGYAAGSTILFNSDGEHYYTTNIGIAQNNLTLDIYGSAEKAIINTTAVNGILVSADTGITIRNLHIKGITTANSLAVQNGSDNFTAQNLEISNSGSVGILYHQCDNGLFEDIYIHDTTKSAFTTATASPLGGETGLVVRRMRCEEIGAGNNRTNYYYGIFVGNSQVNFLVEDCSVKNNYSLGPCYDFSAGDSTTYPVQGTVKQCYAENGWMGFSVSGDNTGGAGKDVNIVDFISCISRDQDRANFEIHGVGSTMHLYNCASLGRVDQAGIKIYGDFEVGADSVVEMYNCILDGENQQYLLQLDTDYVTYTGDYNIMYGGYVALARITESGVSGEDQTFTTWKMKTSQDSNSLNIDPQINSSGVPDPYGPCYHAGTPVSFSARDFKGHRFNITPTIGAYEFTSGSPAKDREVAI